MTNFSYLHRPTRLNQVFRFHFDVPIELARRALLEGISNIPEILKDPAPRTLIIEVTESWVTLKIFYSLKDYGTRYRTGDLVISQTLERIRFHKLAMAGPSLHLISDKT